MNCFLLALQFVGSLVAIFRARFDRALKTYGGYVCHIEVLLSFHPLAVTGAVARLGLLIDRVLRSITFRGIGHYSSPVDSSFQAYRIHDV